VLIADDEKSIVVPLRDDLEAAGHRVTAVGDGLAALERLGERPYDCVITDMRMPGLSGMDLLKQIHAQSSETEVIVVTGYGTIENAVEAMKNGACDYILKPFLNEEIVLRLQKIDGYRKLKAENRALREELDRKYGFENLIGRSRKMDEVFSLVMTVAKTDSSVLIEGESGTGKELIAHAIHHMSPRRDRPFVPLSCAGVPEALLEDALFGHERGAFTDAKKQKIGSFERAHGGTIFLDDIDDMAMASQVKLLRVLQEREFERLGGEAVVKVDVRIVAATKVSLETAVREGKFREDLYYRLSVVPLRLPPLRERADDIPLLVFHFVRQYGKGREYVVKPDVLEAMMTYPWPGNVRELENAVERAIALAGDETTLKREHLLRPGDPARVAKAAADSGLRTMADAVAAAEIEAIRRALRGARGHKAEAARLLGISRKSLWEKMKEYAIED
jgi:two-component system, NtrC family, response regulator